MTAFIFITGGVMSSVGKGITTASIAKILQVRGLSVTAIKIDPYLNVTIYSIVIRFDFSINIVTSDITVSPTSTYIGFGFRINIVTSDIAVSLSSTYIGFGHTIARLSGDYTVK